MFIEEVDLLIKQPFFPAYNNLRLLKGNFREIKLSDYKDKFITGRQTSETLQCTFHSLNETIIVF